MRLLILGFGFALLLLPQAGKACLWDNDTLEMERQRFPSTLELIAGKFLRHSGDYYRWRIVDRKKKLKDKSLPELYDDLGVAYDKLGMSKEAIETATKCEQLFPDRYETAANLGTFYIHAGNLEEGLKHISRALEINPDAHFGRERYQKLLVEYLLSKQRDGKISLPLDTTWPAEELNSHKERGFAIFCQTQLPDDPETISFDFLIEDAITGVQGMMKFGHHDSPVLLEALGDLLLANDDDQDAKRMAARAYIRAAESAGDSESAAIYRNLAAKAIETHSRYDEPGIHPMLSLGIVEQRLKYELEDANLWFHKLVKREQEWIEADKDVDAKFKEVYYNQSPPTTASPRPLTFQDLTNRRLAAGLLCFLLFTCGVIYFLVKD